MYMAVTEDQLNRWASAPSETENVKCENAIRVVSEALRAHFGDSIYFVRQGSHRNRTNIRLESDVDLAVVHSGYYFPDIDAMPAQDQQRFNNERTTAAYPYEKFKSDVYSVLQNTLGTANVERKSKCIRIKANTSRVNADVVPVYEHTRYQSYGVPIVRGVGFIPDGSSSPIYSYPEQHYANGTAKNTETHHAYKSIVRILKNMRDELTDKQMPSFMIESAVWNVPNRLFNEMRWRDSVSFVTAQIWQDMQNATRANEYVEVSGYWRLFPGAKRTPQQMQDFMLQAWQYVQ